MKSTTVLLTGLVILGASPGVAAQPGDRKVTVLIAALDSSSEAELGRLERAITDAVGATPGFAAVPLALALDPEGTGMLAEVESEGARALEEGLAAYRALDTVVAARRLTDAAALYEKGLLPSNRPRLVEARTMLAAALWANGEERAALSEAERVLALEPSARFSADFFPPDALRLIEGLRRVVVASLVTVTVRGEPRGASLYVDGVFEGVLPRVLKLRKGRHVITALTPGFGLRSRVVGSGGEVELNLTPSEGFRAYQKWLGSAARGQGSASELKEVMSLADVELSLVVTVRRTPAAADTFEATLARVSGDTGLAQAQVTTRIDLADQPSVVALVGKALREEETPPQRPPVSSPLVLTPPAAASGGAEASGHRRVLGLVLVSSGAALAIGSVIAGVRASSLHSDYRARTQLAGEPLRGPGATFAVVADVTALVGLAAGGVGAFLLVDRDARAVDGSSSPVPSSP